MLFSRGLSFPERKKLIEDNISILKKYDGPFKEKTIEKIYETLNEMHGRVDASGIDRPLVLEEFDDLYQTSECEYGVTRDSVNKRITILSRINLLLGPIEDPMILLTTKKLKFGRS